MDVSNGARLGPYEITGRIGAGGMGEVFRAKDTRLDRSVAIKVLPSEFAANAQLRARFEREARAISQLNHPNICTLYDVGDGYIVMELLEGESLAERLVRGRLPISEVLRIGSQIADALERAHRNGIVHRDLKPGNIMLTKSGAKLLDFGLAKGGVFDVSPDSATQQQQPLTQEGTILGTFQYMAPEQLEGADVDHRADIFAFGAVLYEMATGRRAFEGKTKTSLIAAIVAAEPKPMSELQPLTPRALEQLVRACLAKDREDRIQTAHDLALELRWIAESASQSGVAAVAPSRRTKWMRVAWPLAMVVVAIAAWLLSARWQERNAVHPVYRAAIETPAGSPVGIESGRPALSPDGSHVVIASFAKSGGSTLLVRKLGDLNWRELNGTEGAYDPFWSPDGKQIAFFSRRELRKVALDGNSGSELIAATGVAPAGGTWSSAGTIVFATRAEMSRVKVPGGEPAILFKSQSPTGSYAEPYFLPDGNRFLFTSWQIAEASQSQVWIGTLDGSEKPRRLIAGGSAQYANGYLFFAREGALYAQPFDASKGALTGEPQLIANAQYFRYPKPWSAYAVAANELLVLPPGSEVRTQLTRVDHAGKVIATIGAPAFYYSPRLSHDGKRVAVDISDSAASGDVWQIDVASGTAERFAFDAENESAPLWSPHGDAIAYFEDRGANEFVVVRPSAGGAPKTLPTVIDWNVPSDWSLDGTRIFVTGGSLHKESDIYVYSLAEQKLTPIVSSPAHDGSAHFSPDGRWFVYQSDERGQDEIYVQPFPPNGSKWQVSVNGGRVPLWSADGKIYFEDAARRLNEAVVSTVGGFACKPPQALFPIRTREDSDDIGQYDVAGDGTFLINAIPDSATSSLTLVVNWRDALAK